MVDKKALQASLLDFIVLMRRNHIRRDCPQLVKYPQRHQQSLTFVAFPEIIERIIHNRTLRFGVILLVIIMGFCIEKGCIVHEGMMDGIWSNEEVIKKYLVV